MILSDSMNQRKHGTFWKYEPVKAWYFLIVCRSESQTNLCDDGLSLLEEVEGVEQALVMSFDGASLPFGRGESQLAGNARPFPLFGDVLHAPLFLHQLRGKRVLLKMKCWPYILHQSSTINCVSTFVEWLGTKANQLLNYKSLKQNITIIFLYCKEQPEPSNHDY